MSAETARGVLLWCSVLNYGLLVLLFVTGTLGREWLYRVWGRWFRVSREQFDLVNVGGMILYKTGIFLFNIVPCVALYIVR